MALIDYAGAGARLDPDRGLALDPKRWAWSPKIDGAYARGTTDARGVLVQLLTRTGAPHRAADTAGLIGLQTGLPDATLHGELEAHTEAGLRARAARGWACWHLFDVAWWWGRAVDRRPFEDRHGLLHRWQAAAECYGTAPREDWWRLDDQGDAHDPSTGQYVRAAPRDLRRLPIVPLSRGRAGAAQLWREHVELGGGEGVVAVQLGAPLGARGGKRKVKATDTLDCTVVSADSSAATLLWRGHTFVVSARSKAGRVKPGDVVEVVCDGWYESGVRPRFARIVRRRDDLAATVPA